MSASTDPVIQTCTACGALIDVTDEEPFALMHCPACGAAQRVRRNFDHFELQEILGAGGMGAVYRALDTSLNRSVALKLLRKEYSTDQEFVQQFEKEAAITASINHPNVVKVYTAGQDHGLVYIAMELVDKGSLDDLMNLQGRVAEAQVLEVGIQIASGLNAALQRGLIHRDVKPGNILFADAHTAKIVDFGLAVLQEHASSVAGEVWGTPYYVAPEKLDNSPEDFRSDMYSLGATLFHAVAGRPPFEAETASMVALKHLKSQAVSLQAFAPDVSSATAYVINKTLAKEPGERYQSYDELIEHLEYARNELLAATARGPAAKARVVLEGEETAKAVSWITLGMIVAIVAGGVVVYMKRESFRSSEPTVDPRYQQVQAATANLEPQFQAARKLIEDGEFNAAVMEFQKLAALPDVPQPLLNWLTLHEGLALLFAGREAQARAVFAALADRGPYSEDKAEQKMANFFVNVSKQLAGDLPIQPRVAVQYEKTNYESIALLLYALKDWQMGSFELAGPLFRQFFSARPEPPYDWIGSYQKLSNDFSESYSTYSRVLKELEVADTPQKKKTALTAAQEALEQIRTRGELAKRLEETTQKIADEMAAAEKEESTRRAEQEAADAKAMKAVATEVKPLFQQFKFAEARAAAKAVSPIGKKAQREVALLVKKCDWLATFKANLIADINGGGSKVPVVRRNKTIMPGFATRANDLGIEVRTEFGGAPALWTDLAPTTILTMSRAFIKPAMAPEAVADRQFLAGVFAQTAKLEKEARELLDAAVLAKPEYKKDRDLLLEPASEP